MIKIHTGELDHLVERVDALGGLGTPAIGQEFYGFSLDFDTVVDQSLDPFSEAYFAGQLRLYEEISGRPLNQSSGELTALNVEAHGTGPNPYNSRDVDFIARNSMAVMSMLRISNPPPNPKVIDLGCGWGLSTEMLAFCGCEVTAVDINPSFVSLVHRRLLDRHIDAKVLLGNFDSVEIADLHDLAIFYECLHHAVRPWETIEKVSRSIKPGGKIGFAGEPINEHWWRHWGLRLDIASVYCIKKFGWFESGWTRSFIQDCFSRNGWTLQLYNNVGLDGGPIGIGCRTDELKSGLVRPDLPTLCADMRLPSGGDPNTMRALTGKALAVLRGLVNRGRG